MKLDLRARFNILKLIHYKIYFTEDLDVIDNDGMIQTRSYDAPTLRVPFPKNSKFRNSFYYFGHILWNSLPTDLRVISEPLSFKKHLKRFIAQFE